jgi:hypothetical protein
MATRSTQSDPMHSQRYARQFEDSARTALDSLAGRTLSGAEWAVAQDRLLKFVAILRGWAQKSESGESRFGKVEVPCLREL